MYPPERVSLEEAEGAFWAGEPVSEGDVKLSSGLMPATFSHEAVVADTQIMSAIK